MDKNDELFHEERKLLFDAELIGAQQYDKAILTLSAGALAISITFIRDIAPELQSIALLIIAWSAFSLSMLSTVSSFLISQRACREQTEIARKYYIDGNNDPINNRFSKWTNRLNIISGILLFLGIVFVVIFGAINLT